MIHKIHSRKDFINLDFHHSDASIFSDIKLQEYKNSAGELSSVDLYANLKIRDCDRTVSLAVHADNDGDNDDDFENIMFKIDTIIAHLYDFQNKFKHGYERYKQIKSHIKKI